MENLRKEQVKELYRKITPFASKHLLWLNKIEKWTLNEIYEKCGLTPNRISEIIHYQHYKKDVLTEQNFLLLVGGGILDMKELLNKDHLTNGEKNYLHVKTICLNEELKEVAFKLEKHYHLDPVSILKNKLKELEK